jgi:hypothetical protein
MSYHDMHDQRLRKHQWSMSALLVEHQLQAESYWPGGARWVVGKPGTSVLRFEVIAGICGSLIVHGDIDIVRFGHYSDRRDAWSRLQWMAFCTDVDYYVAQKASIGMGRVSDSMIYDEDVARAELLRDLKEAQSEGPPALAKVLEEALEHYTEDEHELRNFLASAGNWDLWEREYGRCLSPSVILAHLALNKTACLLQEKYGESGPPLGRMQHDGTGRAE